MKKVILSALALVIGAVAFAQDNKSSYPPSDPSPGANPTAQEGHSTVLLEIPTPEVNKSTNTDANTGTTIQDGDGQRAQVRQQGIINSALTIQSNGDGTGGNEVLVTQTSRATGNPASTASNIVFTEQIGTENISVSTQEGFGNVAVTGQGLADDGEVSKNNVAYISQVDPSDAEGNADNFAEIQQDGEGNSAITSQNVNLNSARTIQDGNDNVAVITQESEEVPSDIANGLGQDALVDQIGDDNQATIGQAGLARNEASTIQIGSGNTSSQVQLGNDTSAEGGNTATVAQGYQGGREGNEKSVFVLDDIDGDLGVEVSAFEGDSEGSIVSQSQVGGAGNDTFASQFGNNNSASQVQFGNDNEAFTTQLGGDGSDAAFNVVAQLQQGDRNSVALGQAGTGNLAVQSQIGDDNTTTALQTGTDNVLNSYQVGNNNAFHAVQDGVHNAAFVLQDGGNSYTLQQGLNAPSANNQADIQQVGSYGTFEEYPSLYKPTNLERPELPAHATPSIPDLHSNN